MAYKRLSPWKTGTENVTALSPDAAQNSISTLRPAREDDRPTKFDDRISLDTSLPMQHRMRKWHRQRETMNGGECLRWKFRLFFKWA